MTRITVEATSSLVVDGQFIPVYEGSPRSGVGAHLPTVVLVHGSNGTTPDHFRFLFPMLAVKHRVISLDLAAPKGRTLELADFEQQVASLIAEFNHNRPAVVVGYSLGAVVAASMAANRPDLVERLVLIAGWARTDAQQLLFNRVFQALCMKAPETTASLLFGNLFSGAVFANQSLEALDAMMSQAAVHPDIAAHMDLNTRIDILERLEDIKAATLVIAARQDQMVPLRHGQALFGAIDNATYAEVDCGHAVVYERAAEVLRLIEKFLREPKLFEAGTRLEPLAI